MIGRLQVQDRFVFILCFFIYRFTGAGVEAVGDTETGGADCRLGPTKVHFMYGVLSMVGIHKMAFLLKS